MPDNKTAFFSLIIPKSAIVCKENLYCKEGQLFLTFFSLIERIGFDTSMVTDLILDSVHTGEMTENRFVLQRRSFYKGQYKHYFCKVYPYCLVGWLFSTAMGVFNVEI